MPLANKTLISVGHPAYQGANAVRVCFSKAQVVRVLRNRGVKRDDARKAIKEAMREGGATVKPNILDLIEVNDFTHFRWQNYGAKHHAEYREMLRRIWANKPEQ